MTGYDKATGKVSYEYTLLGSEKHPEDAAKANNSVYEDLKVVLTDNDGDKADATLSVQIVDDVPTATDDAAAQQQENQVLVIDALANDVRGADGVLPQAVSVTTQPAQGVVTYDPATGKFIDFVGFAAIRSGWVLEGTLDVPPLLQRVAFKDAYCEFAFSQEVSHREVLNDDLYFDGGRKVSSIEFFPSDYVLRDYNNNASFDCELPLNECEPYGKYIHIKEKLYTWQIAPDLQSFSVAPVEESLATGFFESARSSDKRTQVALKTGYQPPSATNGTFHGDGKWQLITIDANTRKVELPAGEYLLSQFALRSRDAERNIAHLPEFHSIIQARDR